MGPGAEWEGRGFDEDRTMKKEGERRGQYDQFGGGRTSQLPQMPCILSMKQNGLEQVNICLYPAPLLPPQLRWPMVLLLIETQEERTRCGIYRFAPLPSAHRLVNRGAAASQKAMRFQKSLVISCASSL